MGKMYEEQTVPVNASPKNAQHNGSFVDEVGEAIGGVEHAIERLMKFRESKLEPYSVEKPVKNPEEGQDGKSDVCRMDEALMTLHSRISDLNRRIDMIEKDFEG